MAELNTGEYGQTIYVNLGEDVSTATSYTFTLEPKYGTILEKTGVLGTVNIDVGDESYIADQYISYTIEAGDLEYAGQWRKKGEAVLPTKKVASDYELFTVLE